MPPRFVLRFVVFILLAGVVTGEIAPPLRSPAPGATVTATFWNVQWFPGRRPNASRGEENRQIRAVHDDLSQLTSDIVALEEVRDYEHAALAVRALAGFKVDVCSNFPPREGQKEAQ